MARYPSRRSGSRRSRAGAASALLALLAALVGGGGGCGGGGGGGGGGGDTTVRGQVLAPGGSLTDEATVAELAPVVGANVFVVEVDDAGQLQGPPLVSTTTDGDGRFSFPRPTGGFSPLRFVMATMDGAPGPLGEAGAPRLCAPFADAPLQLDPVSEAAVRHLLEDPSLDLVALDVGRTSAVGGATRLPGLTVAEVRSYLHLMQAMANSTQGNLFVGNLIGTTIEATVAAINANLRPSLIESLKGFANPGEFQAPLPVSGTYHVISHGTDLDSQSVRLDHTTGTLTINGSSATLAFSGVAVERNEACGGGMDPCTRSFVTSTPSHAGTESGTVVLGAGYQATFVLKRGISEWPFVHTTVASGFLTQDAQVFCLTIHSGSASDLALAVRSAGSVGGATMNGQHWLGEHRRSVPQSGAVQTTWNGPTSVTAAAELTFGFPTVHASDTSWSAHTTFTCTPQPMTMFCAASGAIVSQTNFGGTGAGGTSYSVQQGRLDVDGVVGRIAPSARVMVLSESFPAQREVGLGIGIRHASGLDASALNGAYSMVGVEDDLGGNTLNYRLNVGTLVFDGAGTGQATGTVKGMERRTCAANVTCPAVGLASKADGYNQAFSYSVSPSGAVTVNVGDTTLTGQVTQDGFLLALVEAKTSASEAVRSLLVAGKR